MFLNKAIKLVATIPFTSIVNKDDQLSNFVCRAPPARKRAQVQLIAPL
jgi:hypothetical protein